MTHLDARLFSPVRCAECHSSNDPGVLFCRQCGSAFLLDFVKGKVIGHRLGKKLVSTWIALIAVLIGIPAARLLPPAASIGLIISMMIFSIIIVLLAFRDTTGGVVK